MDQNNLPKTLYKYVTEDRALKILTERKIRFTPSQFFNDPFEFRPSSADEFHDVIHSLHESSLKRMKSRYGMPMDNFEYNLKNLIKRRYAIEESNSHFFSDWRQIATRMNSILGILSLTEDPRNILMWGHYGDEYRGVAIGFDTSHEFFKQEEIDGNNNLLVKVKYSLERPSLPTHLFSQLGADSYWRGWELLLKEKHPLFYTKSSSWRYEKEWRLIKEIEDKNSLPNHHHHSAWRMGYFETIPTTKQFITKGQLVDVPPMAIKSIIIGPCARLSNEVWGVSGTEDTICQTIVNDPDIEHIKIYCSSFDPYKYKVNIYNPQNDKELLKYACINEIEYRKQGIIGREYFERQKK